MKISKPRTGKACNMNLGFGVSPIKDLLSHRQKERQCPSQVSSSFNFIYFQRKASPLENIKFFR